VLHNLSCMIQAGEKIGICGPSGCGKSSLCEAFISGSLRLDLADARSLDTCITALALLRFIIPSGDGSIKIDGRPLASTNLSALRERISLIPQDPLLFAGTLRSNLDPNDEHDDSTLWTAIQKSGFAGEGDEGSEGAKGVSLDTIVQNSGANFSQGATAVAVASVRLC
jgi:ATP-binding cassette subfamily C (CFTR/MRP) protein 1